MDLQIICNQAISRKQGRQEEALLGFATATASRLISQKLKEVNVKTVAKLWPFQVLRDNSLHLSLSIRVADIKDVDILGKVADDEDSYISSSMTSLIVDKF